MIDPRLHALRMLATHRTIAATAAALDYSASAVSYQLRSLAADLGVEILERDGRGLRLTPAGRLLLERSDELRARWEEIRAEVAASSPGQTGHLCVSGFSTAAAALLPAVVAGVRERYPEMTVRIIEADPAECFELLLAGTADVAVVVATGDLPANNDERFEQHPLMSDQLDILVPDGHPFAARESIVLSDAAGEQWIADRPGRPYRQLLDAACHSAGFTPQVAHEAVEWDTGAALVDAGLGVALIPRLARIPARRRVSRVHLRGEPTPARQVLTGIRRGSAEQPAIAAALDVLRETRRGQTPS